MEPIAFMLLAGAVLALLYLWLIRKGRPQ